MFQFKNVLYEPHLLAWYDGVVDGMFKKIDELLSSAISGTLVFMNDILKVAFTDSGDITPGGLIKSQPIFWNNVGGDPPYLSPWGIAKSISDNAIMPIAGLILLVVLVNELIQIMVSGNNFERAGISEFGMWFVKAIVGIILVSMVFDITTWMFTLGAWAGATGLGTITTSLTEIDASTISKALEVYHTHELLLILIFAILTLLATGFMMIAIILSLAGRIIECYMYFAISPIPMATMMNNEWKSVGTGWVRGLAALAFQAVFVVIAIGIFSGMFNSVIASIKIGGQSVVIQMIILFAFVLALSMTVLRSGQISKSVFGAS
jgi:hypothetical protein